MQKTSIYHYILLPLIVFTCYSKGITQNKTISKLKFLSERDIAYNQFFKNTIIGGLSGIDYDKKNNIYYLISDDRSAINPARFYTAHIFIHNNSIDSIVFVDVQNMLQSNDTVYPNSKQNPFHTPDPEDIRLNSANNTLYWTSEGERIVNKKDTILENPAITIMSKQGKYLDTFPLPHNLLMHATENGPRQNGVLEGLSFSNNYKTLWVNVEEPLYEDGPRANVQPNKAFIRLYKFDVETKKNTAQYAYLLDPVAYAAIPENGFKINGIPDILFINNHQLLVIERSFSTGISACTIKVYMASLNNATNIIHNKSLKKNTHFTAATKQLLLNMDDLKMYIDNIEGVTFGPTLPNGHNTLLFIADNNFNPLEKTQLLLFEIIP